MTSEIARGPDPDMRWRRRVSILLVEDEVLLRYATADLLRSHGHEVVEAAQAEEATSLLASGLIVDLVLSDVAMPGIGGIRLAELVDRDHPELPIILSSASYSPEIAELPVQFLRKPYSEQDLIDAIHARMQPDG